LKAEKVERQCQIALADQRVKDEQEARERAAKALAEARQFNGPRAME